MGEAALSKRTLATPPEVVGAGKYRGPKDWATAESPEGVADYLERATPAFREA